MTDKQTYWLTSDGAYALATGAEERDRWIPLGWALADAEPEGRDRVWAWHDGIELPAQFPAGAMASIWEPREWKAGPPPGGDHPFAQQPAPVGTETPAAAPDAAKSTTTKAAADGGKSKE